MRAGPKRILLGATTVLSVVLLDAGSALAQLGQSEVGVEPGDAETLQLVTSSTEVRRAVIGLLALAFVLGVLGIVYWYKTGQLARERHARSGRGRHGAAGRSRPAAQARGPQPARAYVEAQAVRPMSKRRG